MQKEHCNMLSNEEKNNLKNQKSNHILLFLKKIKYLIIISEYKKIDNKITLYEKNIDFSDFKTDIKIIALYLP